jgi:hypothetical protein
VALGDLLGANHPAESGVPGRVRAVAVLAGGAHEPPPADVGHAAPRGRPTIGVRVVDPAPHVELRARGWFHHRQLAVRARVRRRVGGDAPGDRLVAAVEVAADPMEPRAGVGIGEPEPPLGGRGQVRPAAERGDRVGDDRVGVGIELRVRPDRRVPGARVRVGSREVSLRRGRHRCRLRSDHVARAVHRAELIAVLGRLPEQIVAVAARGRGDLVDQTPVPVDLEVIRAVGSAGPSEVGAVGVGGAEL